MVVVKPSPRGNPTIVVMHNPLKSFDIAISQFFDGFLIFRFEFELLLDASSEHLFIPSS
jgi:hypothetical protein